MKIMHHRLCITDAEQSLVFYCQKLGMSLVAHEERADSQHYFLAYENTSSALLELVYNPHQYSPEIAPQPSRAEGYWKFSIAVPNLDQVRQLLLACDVPVGDCFEVPDVAYLCHLQDPDGYCIELIQHTFLGNKQNCDPCSNSLPGVPVSLNLSTLRVKDIDASLVFYKALGMKLLSRQVVPSRNMTLYFLSGYGEAAPGTDIDAVEIREWLWQRPYTLLELQHIHGTESQHDFRYRVGVQTGFLGLDYQVESLPDLISSLDTIPAEVLTPDRERKGIETKDPDGYCLRFFC
ncbi:hypothetical protein M3P05_11940 [Sansalvadorimonas sp. 2012CJ34-2]|uniref:VOC domain-containing protein n=1 Tax=Parendozoicomonas callyspongiae TaxID=2942213 RepID=A0ABT0PHA6_9GAMM|nr:VOC family protein [Sansalvadorimonas sp. 2012CJ34-2]MCL6270636.1 hypothetical protein [Sansalvadorimonas sp. 2012CJ34-2]